MLSSKFFYVVVEEKYDYAKRLKQAVAELHKVSICSWKRIGIQCQVYMEFGYINSMYLFHRCSLISWACGIVTRNPQPARARRITISTVGGLCRHCMHTDAMSILSDLGGRHCQSMMAAKCINHCFCFLPKYNITHLWLLKMSLIFNE